MPAPVTNTVPAAHHLKRLIREVPDFPKPGINFYDITTLLKDKAGFNETIDALRDHYRSTPIDIVVGIEARLEILAHLVSRFSLPIKDLTTRGQAA